MYLVGTDILIDVQRGNEAALSLFKETQDMPAIPGLVIMELIQSSHNKIQAQRSMRLHH